MKKNCALTILLLLLSIDLVRAQGAVHINENETTAILDANRLSVGLALENSRNALLRIKLEVLNAKDDVISANETAKTFNKGKQIVHFQLEFTKTPTAENLVWHRLRYSVLLEDSGSPIIGIISLSEIMPELFELQVSAPKNVFAGMKFISHVLALHPMTNRPIKNVEISGIVTLELVDSDEDELNISAKGKTNDEGFATLDFAIPEEARLETGSYNAEIAIKGEKNGLVREAEEDLDVPTDAFVYLNTDKPLYQPGQKLFVRGLYLNSLKKPVKDAALEYEITAENGETVYTVAANTSRFGVSSIEWQIPENIKLGTYSIEVRHGDGGVIGLTEIKITRYELPNFAVNIKPDRTYYLPDQTTAEVTVDASYLFGKPVAQGRVRIVGETKVKHEDEIEESPRTYEGETDADGKFTAKVYLAEGFAELQKVEWMRFRNLIFTAYFTDATTNRTEQRRFDLRLTKEAIHIYFIRAGGDINPKIPFQFYVSTFYADGTPARAQVTVKGDYEGVRSDAILAAVKTNSYGAGKFEIHIPDKPFPDLKDNFELEISAADKDGKSGTFAENLYVDENERQVFVKTDQTIYLPEQPIDAQILSSDAGDTVFVEVLKNSSVIWSKRIQLRDGSEDLRIPFRPDFAGELTLAVYARNEDNYGRAVYHAKTIIYPSPDKMDFNLRSLKTVYRPGDEASLDFRLRDGRNRPVETALGLVVLDKAIEERARTEWLPGNYAFIQKLLGTADSFGDITRRDLRNLDLRKPISADLQLAAEFLLVRQNYQPQFFESDSYLENFSQVYKDYFIEKLKPLETALNAQYEKTGEYPADEQSLRKILSIGGLDLDDFRDPWGMPFQPIIEYYKDNVYFKLKTAGADKQFESADDLIVKALQFQRFAVLKNKLNVIFNNYALENGTYPKTVDELRAVFKAGGVDIDALRDESNRPFYLTATEFERLTNKVALETIGNLDGERQQQATSQPVRQKLTVFVFRLKSAGKDGVQGQSSEDHDVAVFTSVLSEINVPGKTTVARISKGGISNSRGALGGTLYDQNGAVIPGATVTAENPRTAEEYTAATDENGYYLIENLPSGKYTIKADSPGFQRTVIQNVVISSMNIVNLDMYLEVGFVNSVVEVTAASETIYTTSMAITTTVTRSENGTIAGNLSNLDGNSLSTPRVREYFPETLVWQPEIITDKQGRAGFKFKLADSLTTWKLYAIGSSEAGDVGLLEKEIKTFQPFFAELDPPRVLTVGDEISLPTPIRNYTDKRQKVAVSMAANNWSTALNGLTQQIEIAANASQNAVFNFRADAPAIDAKQRITARANNESDAVEKPVTVNPNGREIVRAESKTFREDVSFEVNFPQNALAGYRTAELKLYPNLLANVAESVEGLLQRPHGCGEQTTSSTYPNLMILKFRSDRPAAAGGITSQTPKTDLEQKAQNYLLEGYERLLNYQTPSGGFSYWGKTDTPRVALTAYVLRFLNDADEFIEVDEKVVENAQKWLLGQQLTDGSWERNPETTAYVARSVSLIPGDDADKKKAVQKSFEFLKNVPDGENGAYYLANLALALIESGDLETAGSIADGLKLRAEKDRTSMYWTAAGTPFYGWGKTASIETTALVVQVFLHLNDAAEYASEISGGLAFLLQNKDEHGVWNSTQTTINVLDALILVQKTSARTNGRNDKAEIFVNGRKVKEFAVTGDVPADPLFIDVTPFLNLDQNRIEITGMSDANLLMAQITSKYYVDWQTADQENSKYFDLKVGFDKLQADIGEEIACAVRIERKTYRGNGMILAEIGIPPGADVDRASLDSAVKNDGISRYDVLPDKVVIYAWAGAKPLEFRFKFRERYGIDAQNSPSVVYDYYNPEAQAIVAPVRFLVK